jgi:hypothetical protein
MTRYKPPPTLEPNQPHHAAFERHFHAQVVVENKTVQINQMQLILLKRKSYNFLCTIFPAQSSRFLFLKYFLAIGDSVFLFSGSVVRPSGHREPCGPKEGI